MSNLNIDRVVAGLQSRGINRTAVALTDYKPITKTLARVVLTVAGAQDVNLYDTRQAIASALNGAAFPVLRSFRSISSHGLPAMVGFVRANREVKPYDKAEVAKMRVMAKNMLMDAADDSLWEIRTAGDGTRLLCRQAPDDLSSVLSSVQASVPRAPRLVQLANSIGLGDAVAFVSPRTEQVRHGFVAFADAQTADGDDALEVVQMPEQNNPDEPTTVYDEVPDQNEAFSSVLVPASLVVAAVSFPNRFPSKEVAAPAAINIQTLKDYYAKIYKASPEYVSKVWKTIDQMAAA